jgi:hypothetical protein
MRSHAPNRSYLARSRITACCVPSERGIPSAVAPLASISAINFANERKAMMPPRGSACSVACSCPPPTIEGLGLETRWLVRAKVEVFCPAMLTDVDGLATTGPNGADDAGTIQRRDEGSTVKHSTGSDDTLTGNETIKQGAISTQIIAPRDFEVEPGPLRLGVQAGQFHRSLSPTSDYCWDWG